MANYRQALRVGFEARYLDALVADGILEKRKVGRTNYYINLPLYAILTGEGMTDSRR